MGRSPGLPRSRSASGPRGLGGSRRSRLARCRCHRESGVAEVGDSANATPGVAQARRGRVTPPANALTYLVHRWSAGGAETVKIAFAA